MPLQHTFVDENQFPWIEIELAVKPFPALLQHVRTLLLRGVRRFLRNSLLRNWYLCGLQNESEGFGAPVKIFDNSLPVAGLVI